MRTHSMLALSALGGLGVMFVQLASGCTVTSTNSTTDSGVTGDTGTGTDSGGSDSAVDTGVDAGPTLGFTPSNLPLPGVNWGSLVDVDLTAATTLDSDVDDSSKLSTTTGGVVYMAVSQSDGSKVGVYIAKSWKIEASIAVHAKGAYPIALVALTTIDVAGTLDASAVAAVPGAGGAIPAANADAGAGPGPGAGGAGVQATGVAAAGGSACGVGGAGGNYTGTTAATLGAAYGTAALVPLVAGSNGGFGTNPAGAGGGAIQLVAGTSITIEAAAAVAANGGGGGQSGTVAAGAVQVGSGGGSGGSLLLESPTVSVLGKLTANGGGGGGNSANAGQDGQNSATGALGSGTGTGLGGNGSGGATLTGAAGLAGSGATGTGNDIPPGGGGGAAGRVRINSKAGTGATIDPAAVLSPASGTTCVSQGSIAP